MNVQRAKVEEILQGVRSEGRSLVLEPEAKEILRAYGISTTEGRLCSSLAEALATAQEIGYPVVLKIVSPQVVHKTEVGGVKLGLSCPGDLGKAYEALMASVGEKIGSSSLWGFLVERMEKGWEVVIGATRDEQFGPLVMFGLGGIMVEILKDVAYCLAPVEDDEARRMIHRIKGYPLLAGARGQEPADEELLVSTLQKVSCLLADFQEIKELDLNPTFVGGPGRVVVADARILTG